jgi:hypothetical protein
LKEYERELKTHMYKIHYDVYLATMKELGAFVTKHTVINYVNQLAAAQQLSCLNASASASLTVDVNVDADTTASDGANAPPQKRKPFQRKSIERSNTGAGAGAGAGAGDAKSGFRSAKPSRGGRMAPTLSVQTPKVGDDRDVSGHVKGSKGTGVVKVQNRFAGLDIVD